MSQLRGNGIAVSEIADPRWKDLYQLGGIASIVVAAGITLAIAAFFVWPFKPGVVSTAEVFALLQNDLFGGLISLDLLMILLVLINILPLTALYVALKPINESYALLALIVGLIAVAVLIPARPIAELVLLSEKYAAATTALDRSQYLAAGEALLALFNGTAWMVQTVFLCLSGLISSLLMLRSRFFGKATAYIGIVASILGFGFFLPVIGILLLFINTIASIIWNILIARDLFRLMRQV